MSKLQIDGTALAAAILAAAFGFSLLPGPFSWLASIAGLVLAIVLFAFDREGQRSLFESLGFAAVVGLCLTLASAVLFRLASGDPTNAAPYNGRIANEFLPLFWVAATVLIWVIDRARMPNRVPYGTVVSAPSAPGSSFSFVPRTATVPVAEPVAAHSYVQHPVPVPVPAPAPQPASSSQAAFTQPSFGSSPEPLPVARAAATAVPAPPPPPPPVVPAQVQAAPLPAPEYFAPAPPPVVLPPAPIPAPAPAAPVHVPSGKETTIYVSLVGEGLNVLRAVRAEHLGRDYYKIIEEMPSGETWQFGPGQVVRAKKRSLSSGKAMVATEEAPRAQ